MFTLESFLSGGCYIHQLSVGLWFYFNVQWLYILQSSQTEDTKDLQNHSYSWENSEKFFRR